MSPPIINHQFLSNKLKNSMMKRAQLSSKSVEGKSALTNPKSRFNAMLNFGGSSGSHLHRVGVQVTKFQHLLANELSLAWANLLFSSILAVDGVALASSPNSSFLSWGSGDESGGVPSLISFSVILWRNTVFFENIQFSRKMGKEWKQREGWKEKTSLCASIHDRPAVSPRDVH